MKLMAHFRSVAARLFHRAETEGDLEEELQCHIESRAEDLERSGLDRAAAERRARIEFGGRQRFKEETREMLGANFIDILMKDLRFSLRLLLKSPGFTIIAILTLAVAIGANAVVFGVLNGLILRPLDVPQPESLYGIEHASEHNMVESYPDYVDLRDRNRSFDALAGFAISQVGLDTGRNPSRAWVYETTGNYFDALHIQPYLGRVFHGWDEHGPDSAPYIVLAYAYWKAHFQEDRQVVGRSVRLNKHPFTILGVAPPEFRGTLVFGVPDFFVPMVNQEQVEGRNTLNARATQSIFMILGHLKKGLTPDQAAADLNSIGAYLERTYPTDHGATSFLLARPGLYGDRLGGPMRAFVSGLMLLAGLILLAACANLGSLFAARAADRSREIALRLALGASRSRILRGLLTEATLIALAGGALGLSGSIALLRVLSLWRPISRLPLNVPVSPDANVYAVAVILALVSGLVFGIVPIRQVLRANPYGIIKGEPGGAVGRRITVRDMLLVLQVAICGVLVTSSLVAVRGLARSLHSDFGFEPRHAMLVETDLAMAGYAGAGYGGDGLTAMQKRMIFTVSAIPGVDSVGLIDRTPLYGGGFSSLIFPDNATDLRPSKAAATAFRYSISPEYFQSAGTTLLAGRVFSWHDDRAAPRVAVINREFARKVFGSTLEALGGSFKLRDGARIQVAGVVEDGKYMNLTEGPEPALFLPILQSRISESCLVVRSSRDPQQLAAAIRSTLRGVDAGLPVLLETWNQQLDLALFPSRIATVSLGVLGGMGAILVITGIFGMASNSVARRLKELGIRMAIGASSSQILQAALGRAFKLLAFGSVIGLILGMLATRMLGAIVYQANPRDPVVFAGMVIAMLLLGMLSTWIPAQRAISVDPLKLLRED